MHTMTIQLVIHPASIEGAVWTAAAPIDANNYDANGSNHAKANFEKVCAVDKVN